MWPLNSVAPSIVVCHSVCEIDAACIAGGMTIETGLRVATRRDREWEDFHSITV